MLGGETLLARAVRRLDGQVMQQVLNANGDPTRFAGYGLPVAADSVEGFAGPLAGVLAGLDWVVANRPDAQWVVTRSEEHTSELQSLMRISYAVFCLKKKKKKHITY